MARVIFSIIVYFIALNAILGQTLEGKYKITGTVVDNTTGKSLLAVTVSILKRVDGKIIKGTTTNEKGYFIIDNISERYVKVRISSIGYQSMLIDSIDLSSFSRLGLIKIKSIDIIMPEVIIKSFKPMIEHYADREVLNFDRLPGNSGSVTEVLKNSGIVDVDPQNYKISIRGQDVRIQMDGHQYEMSSEMLSQYPAAMIEQAEVIFAPGAKESAEGGTYIINLLSKKNTYDNYSGSVSFSASSSNSDRGGLNINYKVNKFNYFSQIYGNYSEYIGESQGERYNYNSKSMYYQKSQGGSKNYNSMGYVKIGMDCNINDNNSMTLVGSYNMSKILASIFSNYIVKNDLDIYQYGYLRDGLNEGSNDKVSLSGFYKKKYERKGKELTIDMLFTIIDNPLNSALNIGYNARPNLPEQQKSITTVNAKTLILKTDYTTPMSSGKIETGYSFTYRNRGNNYNALNYSYTTNNWIDSMALSNTFKYNERIHAAYASASYKINLFDIRGGIRLEYLNTIGNQVTTNIDFSESFLNYFPSINVSYKLNDYLNLGFNTFRRVTYPQVLYINPFRQYKGPNTYSVGNPKLRPYFVNSYAINLSQYINVYYIKTTGCYSSANAIENDSIIVSSYVNLDHGSTLGIDLAFPYYNSPAMPFHLPNFISMFNIRFSYLSRKQEGKYLKEDLTMNENSYSINMNLGLEMWYSIEADVYFTYKSNSITRISTLNGDKDISLYLSKSFMQNKLRFNISINDLLDWQKRVYENIGSNYYMKGSYIPQNSRSISIGITYMFNDFKERRDRNIDDGRDNGTGGLL